MNFSLKNDFLAKNGQKSKKITSFRKKFSESIQNVSKRILKQKSRKIFFRASRHLIGLRNFVI